MKQQYLQTGKIVSTHGLHGEVKILPWADGPEFLLALPQIFLSGRAYPVEAARVQKGCVLMKLAGVDDVEAANRLREQIVCFDRADVRLPEGAVFIQDLLGLPVYEDGVQLGVVKDVLFTGANDVYVVQTPEKEEILIPAVPEFILERNTDEGFVRVRRIEGM